MKKPKRRMIWVWIKWGWVEAIETARHPALPGVMEFVEYRLNDGQVGGTDAFRTTRPASST